MTEPQAFLQLHRGMCSLLSAIVCKILAIFPELEASRPRSKSGIQALCSLHVALEKAKSLLQHYSDCSTVNFICGYATCLEDGYVNCIEGNTFVATIL
ncbi:hypothetical protein Syun_028880 [Stephania yunnanensis]|uniref:Uncharacterized protein n=1 Tax=Stephania yunnanensis TaxID=152371 RepID=A0AAP0E4I0_9MAGN